MDYISTTTELMTSNNIKRAYKKEDLTNNNISVIFKDSHNELWIGTYGGGICHFNRSTNQFDVFDERNGLNNKAVMWHS